MSKFLEQEKANRARRKTDNMSMKEILVVKNVRTKKHSRLGWVHWWVLPDVKGKSNAGFAKLSY